MGTDKQRLQKIGNYEILTKLGEGGMGSVYHGRDLTTGIEVAIKLVRAEVSSDPRMLARFRREISLSKKFAHPFVIKILDGGFIQELNCLYLVMEFLEGQNLHDLFLDYRAESAHAVRMMKHMAEALSYIHSFSIVHRDIKPENILAISQDRTILLDFGLALAEDLTRLSQTSDRPGTWITMSPEQLSGGHIDGRSDIYSLGISMYWVVSGRGPYNNDDIIRIASGTPCKPAATPIELNPLLDEYLSAIIMKCIETDPNKRFQSGEELLKALASKTIPVIESPSKLQKDEQSKSASGNKKSGAFVADTTTISGNKRRRKQSLKNSSEQNTTVLSHSQGEKRSRKILPSILLLTLMTGLGGALIYNRLTSSPTTVSSSAGKRSNTPSLALLTTTWLERQVLPSDEECAEVGKLVIARQNTIHLEYGTDHPPAITGLYYLFARAMKKGLFEKALEFAQAIIERYGYNSFKDRPMGAVFLCQTAAPERDALLQKNIQFARDMVLKAKAPQEKYVSLCHLALALNKYHSSDRIPFQETQTVIEEALKVCRKIESTYLTAERLPTFVNVYASIAASSEDEEERDKAIAFFQRWLQTPDLSPLTELSICRAAAKIIGHSRNKGWEVIPQEEVVLAAEYMKKAVNIGRKIQIPYLMTLQLEMLALLTKIHNYGKKEALAMAEQLMNENPSYKDSPDFVLEYASLLNDSMKVDEALEQLRKLKEKDDATDFLNRTQRWTLTKRIKEIIQVKNLLSVQNALNRGSR